MTKKRLVIADDEKNILSALREVLSDNYILYTAKDGNEALGLVRRFVPDLVLLDILMPGMDGFEVCKQIKSGETTRNIPVVFLTAKTHAEDARIGFESGASAYIPKPFSPVKLLDKIKFIIDTAQIRSM